MKYNKLVRDKIPEIIKNKGEKAITHIANDSEYWQKLKEKLKEEMEEFNSDGNKEEIADILEVLYAILDFKGYSKKEIESIRSKKFKERGGFKEKIILEES